MKASLTFQRKTLQRGATMIIALVLLAAMALLAVFAFNSSTGNLRIVRNSQLRQEAQAAAQTAIETTISTLDFANKTAAVAASPVDVDVDGDGATDYSVAITPTCYRYRELLNTELDLEPQPDGTIPDKECQAPPPDLGIDSDAATVKSLCAATEWNVRAQVNDAVTGVVAQLNQGMTVRVGTDAAMTSCL